MVSSFSKKPAVRYLHTDVKPYTLVSVLQFPNRGAVSTPNSCGTFPGRDAAAWHFQVPSHEQKGRFCGLPRADNKCADAPLTSLHAPSGRPTQAEGGRRERRRANSRNKCWAPCSLAPGKCRCQMLCHRFARSLRSLGRLVHSVTQLHSRDSFNKNLTDQ
jgi:hypothetical protein